MTRASGFAARLAFAALAAAGLLVAVPLLAPLLGARGALEGYLLASVVLHLAWLGGCTRRARAAALLAAGLGGAAWLLPLGVAGSAVAAALLLGLCRSRVLHPLPTLRALVVEGLLLGGGLALAALLARGSLVSLALALWGFFLVQVVFPERGDRGPAGPPRDPFEHAQAELRALLR